MARRKVAGANRGIHRRNLLYYPFYYWTKTFFFLFYGKVEIRGRENIPKGEPVIFAPNHQNALMDALIVLFSGPQDVVFLARADIFNKPLLAFFLNSMKILPVFRQRDGAQELSKNEEIFDISVSVLKHRHFLCVMPEGNHGHQRKMRAFGKGIFRIAFAAQKDAGEKSFVKIVPVGLDMGDYVKQNTNLLVNYGKPIEVSDYWEQYEEAAPRAINAAKKDLISELKPLMVDIQDPEYYEAFYALTKIFNDEMRAVMGIPGKKLSNRFNADKALISRLESVAKKEREAVEASGESESDTPGSPAPGEQKVKTLAGKVDRYMAGLKKLNIRDWVVRDRGYNLARSSWRMLSLLVTFPIFLYGFLTNILPYHLPVRMVKGIKDRQFHSSVKAGLGILVLFPPWYAIMTLLVAILTGPWYIWVAFLVSLLPAGRLALYWYFRWKKTLRGSWFRGRLRRKDKQAWDLVNLRAEILEDTKQLLS